jgi:fatty-acid desaturase
MEAYQLSASLVVLVLAIVIGQVTGVLYLGVGTVMLAGTVIWIINAILLRISIRQFKRSMLISKL